MVSVRRRQNASSAKYRTDSCLPRGTGRALFYVCPSCRGPRLPVPVGDVRNRARRLSRAPLSAMCQPPIRVPGVVQAVRGMHAREAAAQRVKMTPQSMSGSIGGQLQRGRSASRATSAWPGSDGGGVARGARRGGSRDRAGCQQEGLPASISSGASKAGASATAHAPGSMRSPGIGQGRGPDVGPRFRLGLITGTHDHSKNRAKTP
jgi:hypothetical protein